MNDTISVQRRRVNRSSAAPPARRGTWFHRWFLSRFAIGPKLIFAALLLLVPLAAFSLLFVLNHSATLREADSEARGIQLFRQVDSIVRNVALHEKLEALQVFGEKVDPQQLDELLARSTRLLQAIASRDDVQNDADVKKHVQAVRDALAAETGHDTPDAQHLAQHLAVIDAALAFEVQIGSDWGLFRDPDIVLNGYSQVSVERIPRIQRVLAELRARAALDLHDTGPVSPKTALELLALVASLENRTLELHDWLDTALGLSSEHSTTNTALEQAAQQWHTDVLPWLSSLGTALRSERPSADELRALIEHAETVEGALGKLQAQLSTSVEGQLSVRYGKARRALWVASILALLSAVLSGILTFAIASRTAGGVRRLLQISQGIAEGRYDHVIDERGADEISRLFAGFAEMQRRLSLQIGTERAQLVINNRIRAALDNVAGNVLVAAASGATVHINKAAVLMLQQSQADLRTKIPEFDAENLHGTSLQDFCESLAGEPLGLMELTETLTREFVVGTRTFRLVANPVLAESGERFGVVVEITDRTAEVAVEQELQQMLTAVVSGELDKRIEVAGKSGFFETMSRSVNRLAENMVDVVGKVKGAASQVLEVSQQISHGNTDLSRRFETQTASLEKTAALMATVTEAAQGNAQSARHANEVVVSARSKAERGGEVVAEAEQAMTEINTSSRRIADIIGVIDEIAFQTNLLALNAAVEAARAGEQGRGFAVVAGEVRNLAGRSAAAAKEIKGLIKDSLDKVRNGTDHVRNSGKTLQEIVASVQEVSEIVANIADASREQTHGIEQVNTAVRDVDELTQQNALLVERAAAASDALAAQAKDLHDLMERYRFASTEPGSEAQPETARRKPLRLVSGGPPGG